MTDRRTPAHEKALREARGLRGAMHRAIDVLEDARCEVTFLNRAQHAANILRAALGLPFVAESECSYCTRPIHAHDAAELVECGAVLAFGQCHEDVGVGGLGRCRLHVGHEPPCSVVVRTRPYEPVRFSTDGAVRLTRNATPAELPRGVRIYLCGFDVEFGAADDGAVFTSPGGPYVTFAKRAGASNAD